MKNRLIFLVLILLFSCSKNKSIDLSQIEWISQYGFTTDQIHTFNSTGFIPAPKIPITIEGITKNCVLALGSYDLIINEKYFDLQKFEPYRITNKQIATRDMLLEEGIADEIIIMGQPVNHVLTYLMKKSDSKDDFAGFIGWQFFQDNQLMIDMENNIIGLQKCQPGTGEGVDFYCGNIPSKENSMIKFNCLLQGRPITASLSTSIRHSYISPEFIKQNEVSSNKYITLDSLIVGDILFGEITCFINKNQLLLEPENNRPIDLIIGLNEIKKYPLFINFCDKKLQFLNQ